MKKKNEKVNFVREHLQKKTEQFQFDSMNEESEYELLMTFERGNFVHERE